MYSTLIRDKMIGRRIGVVGLFGLVMMLSVLAVTTLPLGASGISVASESAALSSGAVASPAGFDASVSGSLTRLAAADPSVAPNIQTFYDSYVGASEDYQTAIAAAAGAYLQAYQTDPAGAQAAFLANFNAAQTDFMTTLQNARDRLTSELPKSDMNAKQTFITAFNAGLNAYGTQLAGFENQISAL